MSRQIVPRSNASDIQRQLLASGLIPPGQEIGVSPETPISLPPTEILEAGPEKNAVRDWFLTFFNDPIHSIPEHLISYYKITREITPTTQRLHWHMVVRFHEKISMKSIKRHFNDNTINCQWRKGTIEQAIAYVSKLETRDPTFEPIEFGEKPKQGRRSDLDAMTDAILAGATKLELLQFGGGNALRHMGVIDRAQRAVFAMDRMDQVVLARRAALQERLEIDPDARVTDVNLHVSDLHTESYATTVAEMNRGCHDTESVVYNSLMALANSDYTSKKKSKSTDKTSTTPSVRCDREIASLQEEDEDPYDKILNSLRSYKSPFKGAYAERVRTQLFTAMRSFVELHVKHSRENADLFAAEILTNTGLSHITRDDFESILTTTIRERFKSFLTDAVVKCHKQLEGVNIESIVCTLLVNERDFDRIRQDCRSGLEHVVQSLRLSTVTPNAIDLQYYKTLMVDAVQDCSDDSASDESDIDDDEDDE